jgi:hypothetical protein
LKLRTRNKNLESIVETLYEELDQYQQQIERMYQGKLMSTSFIQGSLLQGVKRQVRDERTTNQRLLEEIHQLKRSTKASQMQEMEAIVDVYQHECKRLRQQLEEKHSNDMPELKPPNSITKSHLRLLDLMSDENKN